MGMIRNENYYTVFGWMLNKLHLSGTDLIVYAIIYSFSQDGDSEFKGSLSYMSDFTGASEKTIRRSLQRLESDGLIEKIEKNKSSGLANSYKITYQGDGQNDHPRGDGQNDHPREGGQNDHPREGGQNDHPQGGGTKCPPRADKMTTPGGQNDHPFPYYIFTTISTVDNKERKKENRKRNRNIEKEKLSKEKERAQQKFSEMPDDELLAWGEQSIDLTNPQQEMEFYEWCRVCRKRKETATRWRGRVIKNDHVFAILKSHDEIMTEMGVSDALRDSLKQFLRNCYLNKHLISNDKLTDIICRLNDFYGRDDAGKIKSVNTAISGGWYDIRELR